jgi:hypothetical protein
MFYVTMVDRFMSNWGKADKRINMLAFVCETREEADNVERYAKTRTDMENIQRHHTLPKVNAKRVYLQIKTKEDYPRWYQED